MSDIEREGNMGGWKLKLLFRLRSMGELNELLCSQGWIGARRKSWRLVPLVRVENSLGICVYFL